MSQSFLCDTCRTCDTDKDESEFSVRYIRKRDGSIKYHLDCKVCRSAINAKRLSERYYSEPEFRARLKQYVKDNPDKIAKYRATEYQNNREDYLRRAKEWRENNRAERRQIARRYKVKRSEWELNGSFTQEEWNLLVESTGNKCLACGRIDLPLTQDHVVPLSKGGSNTIDNIQPLCGSCNSSKGTKTIDYRKG